ncbi:IPExxxVDY family protein [Pontibacter diazotrophicus]|uniref:IPExxxVDY family protein n=1 Tax=Pontibacter diazotrophicus TaxID=1400979 RepID=A0A3D8L7T2_9BACT|nr:IPExxxVDY family protein [Pontibacter diazotrophicus]RDV13465.1 IPExxxVDY family protein [Pontibacter diazotrophicus]
MKTLRLDIAYEYDFDLYGLVSTVKEHKLAWALNKLLGFRLIKQKDLCYDLVEQEHIIISNYEYLTDYSIVRLLKNRAVGTAPAKNPFLLPEIKEYDYVLQINGPLRQLCPQELINRLLRIPLVQYVKQFDPLTLKLKDNLIF